MTRSMRGEGGAVKKTRKPRGWKKTGMPSFDFCPYCFSPGCDPLANSRAMERKIKWRIERGLCPACGHHPCTCKSMSRNKEEQEWLDEKLAANRKKWLEEHDS